MMMMTTMTMTTMFHLHQHHQPTGTTTMFNHDDETTVAEMITSYSGTVTRRPISAGPGYQRANHAT
jgi:hypothetical protein